MPRDTAGGLDVRRHAGWFPDDQDDLEAWLAGHAERAARREGQPLRHASVQAFADLIETDPVVGMYIRRMIDQVPQTRAYSKRHLTSPQAASCRAVYVGLGRRHACGESALVASG